jgi:UDP:flavonoid glycosyltransferase YjiC (YdhE family)
MRTAVSRVIEDPRYRAAARRMAARLASERDDHRAVAELEQVAARGPATGHPTPGKADSS